MSPKPAHSPATTQADVELTVRYLTWSAEHKDRVRYVIVKDIDRFSRDVLVYHTLRSQFRAMGIVLYSVNQPATEPAARSHAPALVDHSSLCMISVTAHSRVPVSPATGA